jgi:C-terminal processing protease CtpA/Prc
MSPRRHTSIAGLVLIVVFSVLAGLLYAQQKFDNNELQRDRNILRDAYQNVKKHYYDSKFHGLDIDARYREADDEMKKAGSNAEAFSIIADFFDGLNDSHAFFSPPQRPYHLDYGYRMQMIGNDCFIVHIRPGTEAEKSLHLGDRIVAFNTYPVNRDMLHRLLYYFNNLNPQGTSSVVVRDGSGKDQTIVVKAKVQTLKKVVDLTSDNDFWQYVRDSQNVGHFLRHRYVEAGDVMIWQAPEFDLEAAEVDRLFGIAEKHKALILDLRDNPGGSVETLEWMIGDVMDHDVKIADRIGQKELKPQLAKTRKGHVFSGQLIVLVDSNSASAAELFSRVVQLEHRGMVLGDRTSGRVMEAQEINSSLGADTKIFYGFSITDADLIMADGKSLENNGVVPDEVVLPTAEDLAAGRDPVLARAVELAMHNLDPVAAGKMFPYEWLPF